MKGKFVRFFCMALAAVLGLGLLAGVAPVTVSAAATSYKLAELLEQGKIKALGRTQVSKVREGITADWSANGFEINVNANAGYFTVGYDTNKTGVYTAILVDGVQVWRGLTIGTGTVKTMLTAGSHTVAVIREHGHAAGGAYLVYNTISFDGTIETAPAKKDLFIEVVGDSYACGAGSARDYAPGVQWGDMDHTAQGSFGWYLGEMLNADVSIVARGGIGLVGGPDGAQEEVADGDKNMLHVYPYASGHYEDEGLYTPTRQADLVVIELGANDGLSVSDPAKTELWNSRMADLIALVRGKHGDDVKILMLSHSAVPYNQILKFADADPNIYPCHFAHFGNGGAALKSQKEGHPSAADEYEIAEALYKSIQDWDILGAPAEPAEPDYKDVFYYVSETGSNDNDGKSPETPMLTLTNAVAAAVADKANLSDDSRIVVYLQGEVPNHTDGTSQRLGGGSTVKSKSGKKLPVLVTTYNYAETGVKAILDTSHAPVNAGNSSVSVANDITFKDMTIQGKTRTSTYNGKEVTFRDRNFYGGNNHVVFDNVSFTHVGDTPGDENPWQLSPGAFGSANPSATDTEASLTFKNGDYTNLRYVACLYVSSLNGNTEARKNTYRLVIGEGAKMGTVYGLFGTLKVKEAIVEFRGGSAETYLATRAGTADERRAYDTNITTVFDGDFTYAKQICGTGDYVDLTGNVTNRFEGGVITSTGKLNGFCGTGSFVTINGNVTNEFVKGQFVGEMFAGVSSQSTVNGNVTNNISGGEIRLSPVGDKGLQGAFLAGFNVVNITGNVTNNISGGEINLIYTANVDSGIYLGMRAGTIQGDLINNISGGNLYCGQYVDTMASAGIYFGNYAGNIRGTLKNNITGGVFCCATYIAGETKPSSSGSINFGNRTVNNYIGKVESIIGVEGSDRGPRFYGDVAVGGGRAFVGPVIDIPTATNPIPEGWVDNGAGNPIVDPALTSDEVVIKNTIYSGYISGNFFGSMNSNPDYEKRYYNYVIGSVQTDVYGGKIGGSFFGCGSGEIAGHVTTNIYGGSFGNIYGAYRAQVYDGVETTIENMTDQTTVYNRVKNSAGNYVYEVPSYKIYAGGTTAKISARTEGRDAVKLTIAPKNGIQPWIYAPIYSGHSGAGTTEGTTTVSISGGIYPNGFKVDGKTLSQVVASGCSAVNYITGQALSYADTDTALTGYVEIVPQGQGSSRELVYYVRPNGSDSDDGLSFVKAKKTVKAAFQQAVADNGGSTVFSNGSKLTIYVDGTVNAGGIQAMLWNGGLLTTADGKHMETVVETYKYTDTKATIIHNFTTAGSAPNSYLQTDLTLKNVDIMSKGGGAAQTSKLYAAGCSLVFDNANLITDNELKWVVAADHFGTGGINPTVESNVLNGSLTFRNGDYTGLNYVTTVNSGYIWISEGNTNAVMPNIHCKLIIEDGAIMKDVYGPVGNMQVGSSLVEVRGGKVNAVAGTGHGSKNIKLDTNVVIKGGEIGTLAGTGGGINVKLTGDVNITVSGGTIGTLTGTGTGKYNTSSDGATAITGDVNINVTGGTINNYFGTGHAQHKEITVDSNSKTIYGKLTITGNVNNNISGGTVNNFSGTGHGSANSTNAKVKITKNVNNTISGGTFGGKWFLGAGNYLIITGSINNTIFDGSFTVIPENSNQKDAYFFAGRDRVTAGGVNNTITGGEFVLRYDNTYLKDGKQTSMDSAFYFGGGPYAQINGNVTNKITDATFRLEKGKASIQNGAIHLGQYSGNITGTLRNEIGAVRYDTAGLTKTVYCGPRATNGIIGKIENIIGDPISSQGPDIGTCHLSLGAGWNQVGVTAAIKTEASYPAATTASTATENVVITNKIYGGTFLGDVYASTTGANDTSKNYYTIVNGSVQTDIYGGSFNNYYGAAAATVFGHVTTNIYGGSFNSICGARNGIVYDGVELNIYGMTEGAAPAGIWAGGTTGKIYTATENRDAVKLTIAPESPVILSMPISAGCNGSGTVDGTTTVAVSGGTFTNGFAVNGKTVAEALADGYRLVTTAGNEPIVLPEDALTSGTESVTVVPDAISDASLKFSGASLALYEDLGVKFKAKAALFGDDGFTDPYVVFTFGQSARIVEGYVGGEQMVFPMRGIAPNRIGDTIVATLYATKDGKLYAGNPVTYSVKDYCYNMLLKYSDDEKLRTLLVDLLNYGSLAQQYTGYNTDSLVNADLGEAQKAWGTSETPSVENITNLKYETVDSPTVTWTGGGLALQDSVAIRLRLKTDSLEGLTVKVTMGEKEYALTQFKAVPGYPGEYYVYFRMLNAGQMRTGITATACRDGQAVSDTVLYSIESYVASKLNATEAYLADLVKAMIRYGDSAENYVK